FQEGANGYAGTVDTEIWALATTTILAANPNASSDSNNDGGESQVLLRFDDIIGDQKGQINPHARVISAKLLVSAFDQGDTVNLHRMLVPFDRAATWNSVVAGISADGFEASRHKDSFTFGKISANASEIVFDVTDTVQSWVNGDDNHGWAFLNTGGNGWDFYTSEAEILSQRPKLVVELSDAPVH
ncbi:DNRLRE domain-containing protein, partial [Schlesneria sp.]